MLTQEERDNRSRRLRALWADPAKRAQLIKRKQPRRKRDDAIVEARALFDDIVEKCKAGSNDAFVIERLAALIKKLKVVRYMTKNQVRARARRTT